VIEHDPPGHAATWPKNVHGAEVIPPRARDVRFWEMRPGLPSPAAPGAGPFTRLQFP
jgi:hypothetical protein